MTACDCSQRTAVAPADAEQFARHLVPVASDSRRWLVWLRCPETGRLWIELFPDAGLQGGGAPELRLVPDTKEPLKLVYESSRVTIRRAFPCAPDELDIYWQAVRELTGRVFAARSIWFVSLGVTRPHDRFVRAEPALSKFELPVPRGIWAESVSLGHTEAAPAALVRRAVDHPEFAVGELWLVAASAELEPAVMEMARGGAPVGKTQLALGLETAFAETSGFALIWLQPSWSESDLDVFARRYEAILDRR